MKQLEFKSIMIMSKNEVALPELEGCKREFAVNQAYMISRCKRFKADENKMLWDRQSYLIGRIRELEHE